MSKRYMIDIETTGTDKEKDEILEIGVVEVEMKHIGLPQFPDQLPKYWVPTGREFHMLLHYAGEPQTVFAKDNMVDLYKRCNDTNPKENYHSARHDLTRFIHGVEVQYASSREGSHGREILCTDTRIDMKVYPKMFIGLNGSGFDLPFICAKNILTPSYHELDPETGKEILKGDVHYRIYEQTGALQLAIDSTGLHRKTVQALAKDLGPKVELPKGKSHDALYDCYDQINNLNGLIDLTRRGWIK